MSPRLILLATAFIGLALAAGAGVQQPTPPQPADNTAGPAAPAPPAPPDQDADAVVALLKGSFAATPGAPSETDVPLSWNAAPVELNGVPRAVYFEVARTDDPANPFRQGVISLYRAKRELRLRLLDFANQAQADALVGLWAAPQAFPRLGAEQLRPVADLVLTREGSGGYTARSAHPYPSTRSGAIEATSSLRISADGLTADDRGFDADGKQVWGPHSEQGQVFRHVPAPATADTRDNGLVVIDLVKGNADDGTLETGGQVAMQFTAWTTEGLRLGTSRGAPARQMAYPMMGGWPQGAVAGLAGMAKGGRRRVVAPPAMGFGEQGSGSIPPNATLVFDFECLWLKAPPPPGEAGPPGVPPRTTGH